MKTSTIEQAVAKLSFREAMLPSSLRELRQKLGQKAKQQPTGVVNAFWKSRPWREPDGGNLHVRFDEGEGNGGHWSLSLSFRAFLYYWQQLGLDQFWAEKLPPSREGTDWAKLLQVSVAYRLIAPGSEWRCHRQWYDRSAMGDLLGPDFQWGGKDLQLTGALDGQRVHAFLRGLGSSEKTSK